MRRTSTKPPTTTPPNLGPHAGTADAASKVDRVSSRLPKFLRSYIDPLRNAPVSHISAFLILHELTAVLPLFGLFGLFHYTNWLPPLTEGVVFKAGVERAGRFFRRRGWLGREEQLAAEQAAEAGTARDDVERSREPRKSLFSRNNGGDTSDEVEEKKGVIVRQFEGKGDGRDVRAKWWNRGETGTRIIIEFATAYTITKLLLPARIVLSVWGTPWFARWTVVPVMNRMKGLFRTGKKTVPVKSGATPP